MRNLARLLRLFAPDMVWLPLGLVLALISLSFSLLLFASIGTLTAGFALAISLRTLAIGRIISRYVERLTTHSATFRILARLRIWLFERLVPLAPLQLRHARSGDLLSRLTADIDALDGFYLRLILPLILTILTLTAGALWLASWNLTGALLAVGLLGGLLLLLILAQRQLGHHAQALAREQGEIQAHVLDGLDGLPDLLAGGAGHQQAARIARSTSTFIRHQLAQGRLTARLGAATRLVQALLLLCVLATGRPLVVSDHSLALYVTVAMLMLMAASDLLPSLYDAFLALPRLKAASDRLFALADTPVFMPASGSAPAPGHPGLRLEQVTLTYPGQTTPALAEVSLTIAPAARIALTGRSGAGKSSLALLLLGFISPQTGRVLLNDMDLTHLEGESWRAQIGYLSQQTRLISGTLRENLHLADPVADEATCWQALDQAGLADFVRTLPHGLETWLGDDGVLLSGGQARRVALAMVILRNAPIWLLDEPTEGLDSQTAADVLATINTLTQGKTVLLITHDEANLAPLAITRLIQLEQGRVIHDLAL